MSAHPLSERLRERAAYDPAWSTLPALLTEAASAIDSAATFEADVRGEIERLTEENETLRLHGKHAVEWAEQHAAKRAYDAGLGASEFQAFMPRWAVNIKEALARAAMPAERDEKERR